MTDVELLSAITFGLTYFYYKKKQSEKAKSKRKNRQRRWWIIKIDRNRTRYTMLKLYDNKMVPAAYAVRMVIETLEIPDVEYVFISVKNKDHLKEDFIKLNPQHTLPTLADGDFVIWDSHAIVAYLVGKYSKDDSLYPTNLRKRAVVDQRMHFDSNVLAHAFRKSYSPIVYNNAKDVTPEGVESAETAYDFMEKFLTSDWLTGNCITVADICCAANIGFTDVLLPVDAKKYPKLAAWFKRCSELDTFKRSTAQGIERFRAYIAGCKSR